MRWPDRLAGMIGGLLLLAVLVPMGLMLWSLLEQGAGVLSMDFLLEDPRQAGRTGGIAALLVSTGWILAVCLLVAVPVGLGCALYLSEQVPAGTPAVPSGWAGCWICWRRCHPSFTGCSVTSFSPSAWDWVSPFSVAVWRWR